MAVTNYCSVEDAAQIRGKEQDAPNIKQWWLDAIDALIENHTGQGYKGRRRTTIIGGMNNRYLRLPSKADTILRVMEEDRSLDATEYRLDPRGSLLKRVIPAYPGWTASWIRDLDYTVEYVEPEQVPDEYRLVAAYCVALVLMFAKKHKEFDIALTAHDGASAGKVSTQESTSFPASLVTELNRAIKETLKKRFI